jgi:hypothetical protein
VNRAQATLESAQGTERVALDSGVDGRQGLQRVAPVLHRHPRAVEGLVVGPLARPSDQGHRGHAAGLGSFPSALERPGHRGRQRRRAHFDRGEDTADPSAPSESGGARAATGDASQEPLPFLGSGHADREGFGRQALRQLLGQNLALARDREPAPQSSQPAARPAPRHVIEDRAPQGEGVLEPPRHHPEIVDRFRIGAAARPAGGRPQLQGEVAEVLGGSRETPPLRGGGDRGEPRGRHGPTGVAPPELSSSVTRLQSSSEMSSTERVASRV